MSEGWDWQLTEPATGDFSSLEASQRARISSKLDSIVTDEWRHPADYLEALEGASHDKLRVGDFRLACRLDREEKLLKITAIADRDTAYRDDDD